MERQSPYEQDAREELDKAHELAARGDFSLLNSILALRWAKTNEPYWVPELIAVTHLDVVGWSLRPTKGTKPASKGQRLSFRRDLDNTYDSNAVAVYRGGEMIGYLPAKPVAAEAAPLLFDPASGEPLPFLALEGTSLGLMSEDRKDRGGWHRAKLEVKLRSRPGAPPPPESTLQRIRAFCQAHDRDPAASAAAVPVDPRASELRAAPVVLGPGHAEIYWPPPEGAPPPVEQWAAANRPSSWSERDIHWIRFRRPSAPRKPRPGKWMVFVPTDRLDETWAFVLRQLAGGALAANEAKVPPTAGTTDREKPLLVYCDDWEDRAEVLRVGLQLWKALEGCSATGFARNGALNFKTDEMTLNNIYSKPGKPTSLYTLPRGKADLNVNEENLALSRRLHAEGRQPGQQAPAGGGGGWAAGGGGEAHHAAAGGGQERDEWCSFPPAAAAAAAAERRAGAQAAGGPGAPPAAGGGSAGPGSGLPGLGGLPGGLGWPGGGGGGVEEDEDDDAELQQAIALSRIDVGGSSGGGGGGGAGAGAGPGEEDDELQRALELSLQEAAARAAAPHPAGAASAAGAGAAEARAQQGAGGGGEPRAAAAPGVTEEEAERARAAARRERREKREREEEEERKRRERVPEVIELLDDD